MTPLVDTHCHLLAGLDDGPPTEDEAVEMCRVAWEDGIRVAAATSHMGEQVPDVTPARIRAATERLRARLVAEQIPLTVAPSAEVMIRPELERAWAAGELLGVAGGTAYVLLEFPEGLFFDIGRLLEHFNLLGVQPILAHPERVAPLLHDAGRMEQLVRAGCVMQLSAESLIAPASRGDARTMRQWIASGLVQLVASDGHGAHHRPPLMSAAYRLVERWSGKDVADRLCSINGLKVLEGTPLRIAEPTPPPRRRWFSFNLK